MAKLYNDHHGILSIDFTYPGVDRFRISLSVKGTKETLNWAKKEVLKKVEQEIAARNLQALVDRFPNCKRLKEYVAKDDDTPDLTIDKLLNLVQTDYDQHGYSNAPRFKSTVKHVREYFKGKLATELTGQDIAKYKTKRLADSVSKATINRELSALRRGYTIAVHEQGILKYAPKFICWKEDNAREGYYTQDELQALLKYLPDYLREYVQIAYITGWRKTELISRQWKHVDLVGGYLVLDKDSSKNKEGRLFPLDFPGLRPIIDRLVARRKEELAAGKIIPWLFHRDGEQIMSFRKAWDRAMKEALASGEVAERRLFHDLRRTAVTNLDHLKMPRKIIKDMTGHKTDSVFDRYSMTPKGTLEWVADEAREAIQNGKGGQLLTDSTPLLAHDRSEKLVEDRSGLTGVKAGISRQPIGNLISRIGKKT